jgi:hypothetical protein
MPHFRTGLDMEVERDRDARFRRYDIPPARTAAEIRRSTTSHITDRTMRRHHRSAWCRLRDHTVLAWFVQWRLPSCSLGRWIERDGRSPPGRCLCRSDRGRRRRGSTQGRFGRPALPNRTSPGGGGSENRTVLRHNIQWQTICNCGSLTMDRTRQLTPSGCRQPGPRRKRSSLGTALPCSRTGITTAVASWRRAGQRAGAQALHVVSWHGTRPPRKSARRSDRETGPRGR